MKVSRDPEVRSTQESLGIADSSEEPDAEKNPCSLMWENFLHQREFASFMRQAPEELLQDSTGVKSYRTRAPTSYDTHLVDRQVLKHVVCLPHLAIWIGRAVDEQLVKLSSGQGTKKLPNADLEGYFPTKENRRFYMTTVCEVINYERAIIDQYMSATGYPCGIIASTMMLHPNPRPRRWQSFLTFTTEPPQDGVNGGIADLYMKISDKFQLKKPGLRESLGLHRKDMENWERVRKHFPNLMAFEMKSLLVGNGTVMSEIQSLGERGPGAVFPWKSCGNTRCKTGHKFSIGSHGRDGSLLGKILSEAKQAYPKKWWLPEFIPSPSPAANTSEGQLTEDEAEDSGDEDNVSSFRTEPDKKEPLAVIDPPGTVEDHIESAEHILQQVWAQAVRIDATFLAILAGNYEIIGVRHRGTQTLYITPVINVGFDWNIPHNRLHTGLYISVLKDALERSLLIKENRKINRGYPELLKDLKDFIPPTVIYEAGTVDKAKDEAENETTFLHRDAAFYDRSRPNSSGSSPGIPDPEATVTTPKAQTRDLPPPTLNSVSTTKSEDSYTNQVENEGGLRTPRALHQKLLQEPHDQPRLTTTESRQLIEPHRIQDVRQNSQRTYRPIPQRASPSHELPESNSTFSLYSEYPGFTSGDSVASSSTSRQSTALALPEHSVLSLKRGRTTPEEPVPPQKAGKRVDPEDDLGNSPGPDFVRRRK